MSWETVAIGRLYTRTETRGRKDLPLLSVYRELGVVERAGRDDNFNRPSEDLDSYKVVAPGDLVVNKMKTWQGSLGVSDFSGIVSPAYFVAKPIVDVDGRFMHHLLRSTHLVAEYGARSKGIRPSQWDLPWDAFASIKILLPSRRMQERIADYLDTEVARIDELIEAKKEMISLIDERFIMSVRDVVSEGHHFENPLKCTSDDALGANRKLQRLGWLFRLGGGTTPSSGDSKYYGSGVPWVVTGDLHDESIYETSQQITVRAVQDHSALRLHPAGSLVIALYGATIGKMGILQMPATVNQACCVLSEGNDTLTKFIFYWLLGFRSELILLGRGAGQPNISQELIRSLRVPLPDHGTQESAIAHLDEKRASADELVAALIEQVDLLRERKRSLITAVVTGEMEVP